MRREEILREVEERLRLMRGLRAMVFLDERFRDELAEAERQAEESGAVGGLMPLINEGFWHTMGRQEQVALVLDHTSIVIRMAQSLLRVQDEEGNIIGEWVPLDKAHRLKEREDVRFLGQDFVLYRDLPTEGAPRIVLPEVEFPFLHGTAGVTNVTSASPSGLADELIRRRLGEDGPGLLSHLVGFDLGPAPE